MRHTFIRLFFIPVALFLIFACDSDSKSPDYGVEGEWVVYERSLVDCSDAAIQKEINELFQVRLDAGDEYRLILDGDEYEEQVSVKNDDGELLKEKVFSGKFKLEENGTDISVTLSNLSQVGNWSFVLNIIDPNLKDLLATTQSVTSDDIEKLYLLHFGYQRYLDDGVTAKLKTKAVKINK